MWFPSLFFFSSLIVTSYCQGKFYKLEEDGSILCETRGDCPNDVVNKTNNTVLEFRCAPRTAVGEPGAKESEKNEKIIITEEWYANQTICAEERVHICCTQHADSNQCGGFDKESCEKDNSETWGGSKPGVVSANDLLGKVPARVTVPDKYREKCDQYECQKKRRIRGQSQLGVRKFCCELMVIGDGSACPSRKQMNNSKAICREL